MKYVVLKTDQYTTAQAWLILYLVQEKHRPKYADITYVYVYLFCPFVIEVSGSNYKQLRATTTKELDRMCKEALTA